MTTLEIIETQNEIIRLQETIISELYNALAQHTEMDRQEDHQNNNQSVPQKDEIAFQS